MNRPRLWFSPAFVSCFLAVGFSYWNIPYTGAVAGSLLAHLIRRGRTNRPTKP